MKDAADLTPAFQVIRPARPTPLVYAVAHAGRFYPEHARGALQAREPTVRSLEDPFVHHLVEGAQELGAAILICRTARAYVDVNRDPAEIDPALLEGEGGRDTPRTRAGLGVVPRLGGDARQLHRRRLTPAEIAERIDGVHAPYHAALAGLMEAARQAFGLALLVDWHSMPSAAARGEARRGGLRPDIVIGDRHGESADSAFSGALRAGFESTGRRVVMNRPFAGGHTTQSWGRRIDGFHALQVEIDRSLYLDKAELEPGEGLEGLRADVQAVTRRLIGLLGEKKAAPESAA